MTTYTVAVASYACDDGIAEWIRYNFTDIGDAQDCIDQLDGYEEYEFIVHDVTVNDIPFWTQRTMAPLGAFICLCSLYMYCHDWILGNI